MQALSKYSIMDSIKKMIPGCSVMPYISGFDRDQLMCCSWDSFVDKESIARIIDAFVNSLDISRYGVKPVSVEGRPAYDPKSLYKLYIVGQRIEGDANDKLFFRFSKNRPRSLGANGRLTAIIRHIIGEY